jgi:twitching motility two-component system response regulator PilH
MPTVVIADDSPTLRRIVSTVLSRDGFDVVQAVDGVEAVQAVFRTRPDAVVLDVQMPRVSGYVAARLLKDDWQTADVPVLLLTSLDAMSDRYWGRAVGAERFLTKDFEAPQLVAAVQEAITAAEFARGGRPAPYLEPLELDDDDVLGRVCDLLDRKLFEAQVTAEVTALASKAHGVDEMVTSVLDMLGRVVDYDLAAVMLHGAAPDEHSSYVAVARDCSRLQYDQLLGAAKDALAASGGDAGDGHTSTYVIDETGRLGADDEGEMETFLSMPLMAGRRSVGVLALSSAAKNAFGETALSTLRLVAAPAAIVIDNARLSGQR